MKKPFAAVMKEQALFPAFDILFSLECRGRQFFVNELLLHKNKILILAFEVVALTL